MLTFVDTPARTAAPSPNDTLVLLHAFPLNGHMWEEQRGFADRGWHVIAPHFSGFGGSDLVSETPSMDDYADTVIELLRELGIERAVLGGLSMGGYASLTIMRRAPELVRGLILADTRSEADSLEGREGRSKMLALVREEGADAVAQAMLPNLLGKTTRANRARVVEYVHGMIRGTPPETIASAIYALLSRVDAADVLPQIAVPTLIIVGEEDTITPPSMSQSMKQAIANAELVTIEAAGHLSNLEQPQRFNDALAAFLDHRV